jgi:hypothetical protein
MLPSRLISTSDRGSSGMYTTVPLPAAANCAVLLPPMATPVAMTTGAPLTRPVDESKAEA